jgi:hypothetical protein
MTDIERTQRIVAQYIEQQQAKQSGRGSIVDGCVRLQIEAAQELAARIAGVRQDDERQITLYWAEALGKWVTCPGDAA